VSRLVVHRFGPAAGSGLPVLAIHGVQSTGRRFRRLAEEAWPDRQVLAVDLRGHGDSTWDPPWSAATHIVDLLESLSAEGVDRAAVVGHSFGGLLGTHLAVAAPRLVERLVLLDPAVALPGPRMTASAEETRRDDGWLTREEGVAARLVDRPPQAVSAVMEDLETHLRRDPDGRFRLHFSRPAVIVGWSEIAGPPVSLVDYPGRVLLLTASRGEYVMPWFRAALARDVGERLTDRTIDSGHMVFWDAFEETAAITAAFLDDLPVPDPLADGSRRTGS